jgi:transposase InsO family protein
MDALNEEIQAWFQTYNTERPHENLQNQTPEKHENQMSNFYYSAVA